MKRSPLSRFGKRAKRRQSALEAFRADPPDRCERCDLFTRLDAHHRLPRSRGGEDTAENRAWLCSGVDGCHSQVHDHRARDWRKWIS